MVARKIFVLLLLLNLFPALATKVFQNLYINRGTLITVKSTTLPFLAFNTGTVYNASNAALSCIKGDTLILTVTNKDTALHGFKVKNYPGISYTINPASFITCTLITSQCAVYAFYDHIGYPKYTYLGLAGMIAVKEKANDKAYFWNIKEHQTTYNQQLANGAAVNWLQYYPDYFTINSKSYSDIQNDPSAKITANKNDTVFIYVLNAGQSMHSLHFHGFHLKAEYADCKIIRQNWNKDTWGLFSMDVLVLKMIPDKTGKYSVHDHNLVAVTGGNTHPNGMLTIMQINP
jgi:hypothetical protein